MMSAELLTSLNGTMQQPGEGSAVESLRFVAAGQGGAIGATAVREFRRRAILWAFAGKTLRSRDLGKAPPLLRLFHQVQEPRLRAVVRAGRGYSCKGPEESLD